MLSNKKNEITLEWLLEVGIPPIFAHIIIRRINELFQDNPHKTSFKASDFKTFPLWLKDQENLANTLNRALK